MLALLGMAMLCAISSYTTDQEDLVATDESTSAKIENENGLKRTEFIPNPNKVCHIVPLELQFYRKLGARGTQYALLPLGPSSSLDQVQWKFTPAPTDGYYFIDCLGGGNFPRIRTDNTSSTDMDPTTSVNGLSQWKVTPAGDNTYFLTTKEGTLNRLSLGNRNVMEMVPDTATSRYEEFLLIETDGNNQDPEAFGEFGINHFVGETVTYSVLDNDFDRDGDELTVVNVRNDYPNIVKWEGNEITVTRTIESRSSISYIISDGKGGLDYAAISFRNLGGNN